MAKEIKIVRRRVMSDAEADAFSRDVAAWAEQGFTQILNTGATADGLIFWAILAKEAC